MVNISSLAAYGNTNKLFSIFKVSVSQFSEVFQSFMYLLAGHGGSSSMLLCCVTEN